MRIVQISDIHLSPTHGFFTENWWRAVRHVNALGPDLVVVTGDLSINGPDVDEELSFARSELERLSAPWRAIAGNHDVGDEPPGQDEKQLIDLPRLRRWQREIGASHWAETVGKWRLIGLNAQLFGSGLDAEAAQADWLDGQLAGDGFDNIGIFLHKPLFVAATDDPASSACITPVPRERLLSAFAASSVRFVASGHLHCHTVLSHSGIDLIWGPATSFLAGTADRTMKDHVIPNTRQELGILVFDLADDGYKMRFEMVPDIEPLYLGDIKQRGKYAFLRDMPHYRPDGQF